MAGLFILKVAAGAAYAWLFSRLPEYQAKVDTWRYFYQSLPETRWLLEDPAAFFADLVTPRYEQDGGLLATQNSLLNDLKEVLVIKFMAICNVLSGGRYYVNLIFFNYLVLFGIAGFGLLWARFFRVSRPTLMVAAIALWPSVLFWSSGFHRDGLLLLGVGATLWLAWRVSLQPNWTNVVGLIVIFLVLFLLRNYLALFVATAVALAAVVYYRPLQSKWMLPVAIASGLVIVLALGGLYPDYALPHLLARRQQEFLGLQGGSLQAPLPLDDGWLSLLRSLPEALRRAFAAPLPGPGLKTTEWLSALENSVWLVSILPAVWWGRHRAKTPSQKAWVVLAVSLVLAVGIITGLTIPFVGAIARYKSIIWPLMAPPVVYWWYHLISKKGMRKTA